MNTPAQRAELPPFTMKFDAEGNWKIVKTHRLSKKELEKELQEEL